MENKPTNVIGDVESDYGASDDESCHADSDDTSTSGESDGFGNENEVYIGFSCEYAKSDRSKCQGCSMMIGFHELRIAKIEQLWNGYGRPCPRWYHQQCFVENREDLEFFGSAAGIPGYKNLMARDRKMLKLELPAISEEQDSYSEENESAGENSDEDQDHEEASDERTENEPLSKKAKL